MLERWQVLDKPLLNISYYFKANRSEYYARLMDVRLCGEWETWIKFFLRAVYESAEMGIQSAIEIHKLMTMDRALVESLKSSKPTVQRALELLVKLHIIKETTGNQRRRRYSYQAYLDILSRDKTTRIG